MSLMIIGEFVIQLNVIGSLPFPTVNVLVVLSVKDCGLTVVTEQAEESTVAPSEVVVESVTRLFGETVAGDKIPVIVNLIVDPEVAALMIPASM